MDKEIILLLLDYINKRAIYEAAKVTYDTENSSIINEEKEAENALREILKAVGIDVQYFINLWEILVSRIQKPSDI